MRSSALWAAWGDAVGFICELAPTASSVRSRSGHYPITEPIPWKRRVGGRGGPTVELPAGTISDDTQLRLAVCRTIRRGAGFDPELFAKIELTVWPSYALGAGRGSREAASNLRRRDVSWSTNFFQADRASYLAGGGNGAAMRIQPHVWASAKERSDEDLLMAVVSDAVCTHGHMRGILGAAFHALAVREALETGSCSKPASWRRRAHQLLMVADLISRHEELGGLWSAMRTGLSNTLLETEVRNVVDELLADVAVLEAIGTSSPAADYDAAVEALQVFRPEQRGSGTKTAVLASFLAWRWHQEPAKALLLAANRLGTDTDSIATMAGAIIGATGIGEPPQSLPDSDYIRSEADRMSAIAHGVDAPTFPHPDLRRWLPPRTQSDALGLSAGAPAVAGLGPCSPRSEKFATSASATVVWQTVDLWFGQQILVKARSRPPELEPSQGVRPTERYMTPSLLEAASAEPRPPSQVDPQRPMSVHDMTDKAIQSEFDPKIIGNQLLALADRDDGVEMAVAYTAILAKARLSRRDRDRRLAG